MNEIARESQCSTHGSGMVGVRLFGNEDTPSLPQSSRDQDWDFVLKQLEAEKRREIRELAGLASLPFRRPARASWFEAPRFTAGNIYITPMVSRSARVYVSVRVVGRMCRLNPKP